MSAEKGYIRTLSQLPDSKKRYSAGLFSAMDFWGNSDSMLTTYFLIVTGKHVVTDFTKQKSNEHKLLKWLFMNPLCSHDKNLDGL